MPRPSPRWLLVCACLCLCVGLCITSSQERTHIFVEEPLSQREAEEYCEYHHVSLSSILSQDEYQQLQSPDRGNAWIGLTRGPQNWTWTDGGKPAFYNWKRQNGDCAAVFTHGLWVNRDCSDIFPFICQTVEGKYETVSEEKTWEEAKSVCERKHHTLATFKSASHKPERWPDTQHWMGLKRGSTGWTWVDEDGTGSRAVLTYSNWRTRPDLCGLMSSDGQWVTKTCSMPYMSVCSDGQTHWLTLEPLSWQNAQQRCLDENMHLVSIHNDRQNEELRGEFDGSDFWIGLYNNNPWRWPDGSLAQLSFWGNAQPDNNAYCVMIKDGKWHDTSCSRKLPFFCLMKPLVVQTAASSWVEALLHCWGQGGDLASISNYDNQEVIQQAVQADDNIMTTHVWVGLRFLAGKWLWVSGLEMEYHHWAEDEGKLICPLHHCGAINRNSGYWEPRGCEEKLNFLCQLS